ncbi:MAG: PTS sugar transporter subunit IIA [Calditrichaeota bacterium]|nr:MAG: PTS sugar transporter subunit IIA [Calditrichota bacterium]
MRLDDYLDASLIDMNLKDGTKFEVIEALLDRLVAAGKVQDRERALHDVIEREKYLSTGFENGLAVPHAKTEAVSEMAMAFGLNRKGIDFDSLDGKPTHFVFLLLSPMHTGGPHIQILALIARNFQKPEIVERFRKASSVEEVIELLKAFK